MQKLVFLLLLILSLTNCKPTSTKVSECLTIVEDVNGENIKEDDFLSISYTEKTEEGKLVSSSADYDDRPKLMFRERSYFKDDFFDMLGNLSEGDSAEFKVRIDSIVKKNKMPLTVETKGKYLVYNVRINKVIAREELNDSLYNAAIEDYRKQVIEAEKDREQGKLDRYIRKKNLKLSETASGLKYLITQSNAGNKASVGDTVVVNYTGRTLTGKAFETTYANVAKAEGIFNKDKSYQPYKIAIAPDMAKSGFMEAVMMFPKGTKAQLVIPSKLAYGNANYKMLEPYTPLVCDLEIVDIHSLRKK